MWRVNRSCRSTKNTFLGVCMKNNGPPRWDTMAGTPHGLHDEPGEDGSLPASTPSLSFFMMSLAHCLILGLDTSLIRRVACLPARKSSLLERGFAGSIRVGSGHPGTGEN